jgi:hypothetical protein
MTKGYVYILSNDYMEGLIKIGYTTKSIRERMSGLDNTSIPAPFRLRYAIETEDCEAVEKWLHRIFDDKRIRNNREFFEIASERVIAALKGPHSSYKEVDVDCNPIQAGKPIIEGVAINEDGSENEASIKRKSPRSRFLFSKNKIPIGSEIIFTRNPDKKCTVFNDRQVKYDNEIYHVSPLALKLLQEEGIEMRGAINGNTFFTFEDETLWDRRIRLESEYDGDDDND